MKMCMNCDLMHECYKQILIQNVFKRNVLKLIQCLLHGKHFPEQILVDLYVCIACPLTLYSIETHFDASTTKSFLKHCGKRRNCS